VIRRAAVIGRTRLAVEALDVVRRAGDEIVAVIPDRNDSGEDDWQPSLRRAASVMGLPILQPFNVNDAAFVERLSALRFHFLLSFQASPILSHPLISTASVAALNLHYGPLPRYRGVAPVAWALLNGESETAVTLHLMEPGIDSGPIVASLPVSIGRDETARSLYESCVDAGIRLFEQTWPSIRGQDAVVGVPQEESAALYYNRHALDFRIRRIRWDVDAGAIANRMRAFIFPPLQLPELITGGRCYEVLAFTWDRQPHPGRPGEVLAVTDDAVIVGAPGGRILLHQLQMGEERFAGSTLASALAPGTVFDTPI